MYNYEPKYVREVLNYQAGEIVKHGDYNRNLNLLNVAVDNNTEALKHLLNTGDLASLNALKLDGAELRRHREHILEDNDEQVPSSKAVYQHVDTIRETLQNAIDTATTTIYGHTTEMFNINKRIQVVNSLMEQCGDRADYIERLAADLEKEFEFTHGTLHGGEAGQVLGKQSAEDLDYTWLNPIPGPQGIPGVAGANGMDGTNGIGVPVGGSTGQLLSKIDNTDFSTHWIDPPNTGLTVAEVNALITTAITTNNQAKQPIGSLVFNTSGTNPNTYLGFGTWKLWGAGRVPVCVDTTQTEFNTVEKTGGSKTHTHTTGDFTLTTSHIPSHTHTQNAHGHTQSWHSHTQDSHSHTFSGTSSWHGGHGHAMRGIATRSGGAWNGVVASAKTSDTDWESVLTGGAHDHTYSGTTSAAQPSIGGATPAIQDTTATNQSTGGDGAHNHGATGSSSNQMQFITCYMWKRTA